MRFIDLGRAAVDPEVAPLIDDAEAAKTAILAAPDANARSDLVKASRPVWVKFRSHFERLYGRKCWYTESKNPGTDSDIDHYRPKGRLADHAEHCGYWWEALNWRNFRLSCHHANRLRRNPATNEVGGKGSSFPLLNEADRCEHPDDDMDRERPTILDPTNPEDAALVAFEQDGRVALATGTAENASAQRRFADSRQYLHLDWPGFIEERQALFARIYQKVLEGDNARAQLSRDNNHAKNWLRRVASELIEVADHFQPYSRAAQSYIMRFRDRCWIQQMVLPHIPNPLV